MTALIRITTIRIATLGFSIVAFATNAFAECTQPRPPSCLHTEDAFKDADEFDQCRRKKSSYLRVAFDFLVCTERQAGYEAGPRSEAQKNVDAHRLIQQMSDSFHTEYDVAVHNYEARWDAYNRRLENENRSVPQK